MFFLQNPLFFKSETMPTKNSRTSNPSMFFLCGVFFTPQPSALWDNVGAQRPQLRAHVPFREAHDAMRSLPAPELLPLKEPLL